MRYRDSDADADDGGDDEWTRVGGREGSPRNKMIYAIVLGVAMLVSIVLCCVAAGRAGQLLWIELPPP